MAEAATSDLRDADVTSSPPRGRRSAVGLAEAASIGGADLVAVLGAVLVVNGTHLTLVLPAVAVWLSARLYSHRCHLSVLDDLPRLAGGVVIASLVGLSLPGADTRQLLLLAVTLMALMVAARTASYVWLRWMRRHGHLQISAVVVGSGARTAWLLARARSHPECGIDVIGVLGDRPAELTGVAWLGDITEFTRLDADRLVDAVILADATDDEESLLVDLLRARSGRDVEVLVMPRLGEGSARALDQVWGAPLVRVRNPGSGVGSVAKRLLDVIVASLLLVLLLPVLALAALAVRLELGRGVLFRQVRIGRGGRRFELLKLRSMRDVEDGEVGAWASETHRTGRVGAFIRRYSVDELPQLINVLRGDMSLVGPRPERPEYVEVFGEQVPSYRHRHRVPAGLTGLAAVQGLRGDTSIAERAYFDNLYIEHWSLWLDVKILVCTGLAVLRGTGR